MTNATKTTNDITWHNEATAIMVAPKDDDVAKAVGEFAFPDIQDEASDEPAENTDWTTFDNAAELIAERDAASESASIFFKGESDMRRGLKSLGQHIANVALSLEKPKAFKAWLESGRVDLCWQIAERLVRRSAGKL